MTSQHSLTRRNLVQGSLATGAVLIVGCSIFPPDEKAMAEGQQGGISEQYGFLVDISRCVGCKKCEAACREYNHIASDVPGRRKVTEYMDPRGNMAYVSTSCMHCADPGCMRVCPAGAISKGEAGIVAVDVDRCIGCKYCLQACPYDVPRYNSKGMDKCDCCLGAGVAPGEQPHCAKACQFGALKYGPINELVANAPREPKPIANFNGPSCYIL